MTRKRVGKTQKGKLDGGWGNARKAKSVYFSVCLLSSIYKKKKKSWRLNKPFQKALRGLMVFGGVKGQRRDTAESTIKGWHRGGRLGRRGRGELPKPASLLLDIAGFKNSLSYEPSPHHVMSCPHSVSGRACLSLKSGALRTKELPHAHPGSILSETALGFFISAPCENTGNPASPIPKYLPQEGRYIVFPGPLFCL